MAKNKFSKLNFDITKVDEWIKIWCETNLQCKYEIQREEKVGRISYIVKCDTEFMIDFLKCTGGVHTIQYKVGKNHDISKKVAESIYERITSITPVAQKNNFSILSDKDTYDNLVELLKSDSECLQIAYDLRKEQGYELYKFKSNLGDETTIKYYFKNRRIQIQGKPLYLFHMIQDILITNENVAESVVEEQIRYYNIDADLDVIKEEMIKYFGNNLFSFFTKTQQMILHSAFVMAKTEIELPEYSIVASPAFRVLDGFILKLLTQCGIEHNKELVGNYFRFDESRNCHFLKDEYRCKMKSEENVKSVEVLYGLYSKYRNPYSHTTEKDFSTKVIETRKKADDIMKEIFEAMKTSYEKWKN